MASFNDIADNEDSNLRAQDFVRDKIRQAVPDVETAEKLSPQHLIGCKRLCLGTNYYDTYNRDNVTLISLGEKGVERLTAKGVVADDTEFEIDDLILATGFDAMTGTLSKIPIHGRNNVTLNEAWEAGPRTYLGLMTHGFPNLFMITGPGSPSVLSNMLPTIEQHVEWIAECIGYLEEKNIKEIEPDLQAQDNWVEHGNEIASKTLRYSCSSWYLGANVPGKPRVFMPYIGGMPAYREKCAAVTAAGYEGFKLA
jgi:cyclohexanone monooxygenase